MLENTRQPATGQLLTPIVVPDKTTVPIAFNTQVFQNDMNDGFDHKRLIKMVPKKFQQNAKNLIEAFQCGPWRDVFLLINNSILERNEK